MAKRDLYSEFIERMDTALAREMHLESSWFAYAILEDRLRSLLTLTRGGYPTDKKGNPRAKMTMGAKLEALKPRIATDALLRVNFPYSDLIAWKDLRDQLMHSMADGSKPIVQIDLDARFLATEGARLVREFTAAVARVKKHRKRVST